MMELRDTSGCQITTVTPLKMVDVDRLLFGSRVTMQQGLSHGRALVIFDSPSEVNPAKGCRGSARFFGEAEDFSGAFLLALQVMVRYRHACGELPRA